MAKVALVTGGSKGIGYAAAKALYQMDYIVVVVARDQTKLAACAQGFESQRFIPLVADVTDPAAV